MENLAKARAAVEKIPNTVRTVDLAQRINKVAGKMPDSQPVGPLVVPWNSFVSRYVDHSEPTPEEWVKLFEEELTPREVWSMKELLGEVAFRYRNIDKFDLGDLREYFGYEGNLRGLSNRSRQFGVLAFALHRSEEEQQLILPGMLSPLENKSEDQPRLL